jgi:hypothetical protein
VAADAAPKRRKKGKKAVQNTADPETMELIMPESPTPAAIAASIDIHTIWRALDHHKQEKLLTILTHAELMGLAVRWFSKASIGLFYFPPCQYDILSQNRTDFPETAVELGEELKKCAPLPIPRILVHSPQLRCAEDAGIQVPDNFINAFRVDGANLLVQRMNMCYHVAGTISPLIILAPTQWMDSDLARENLLSVRTLFDYPSLHHDTPNRCCIPWAMKDLKRYLKLRTPFGV